MTTETPFALALDVSGTVTDLILAERSGSRLWVIKPAASPGTLAIGIVDGVDKTRAESGAGDWET